MEQKLLPIEATCKCNRCGARCKVSPIPDSKAVYLKRSSQPKGLCVNCAAHDVLRNLYPVNLLLAQSGPKGLALPHIQKQFEKILKMADTDAEPGEINWNIIIANWDLPFPHKIKRSPANPMNEDDLTRGAKQQKEFTEMLRRKDYKARTMKEKCEDNIGLASEHFKKNIIPLLKENTNDDDS
jgi:hypothetical protein